MMNWILIKKELKEHKILIIAGVLVNMIFALLMIISSFRFFGVFNSNSELPIITTQFKSFFTIICGLFGFLIGYLMTWKESLKKTWAFLFHRPVKRSEILFSKLIAGLIMYLIIILSGFVFLSIWSAIPGHYAHPWTNYALLKGIEIISQGFIILISSFLCGYRNAKWYFSRFIPLIFVIGTLVTSSIGSFLNIWLLVLFKHILLLMLFLFSLFSVFVKQNKWGRVGLVYILTAGFSVIPLVLIGIIFFFVINHRYNYKDYYEDIKFNKNGEIRRIIRKRLKHDETVVKDIDNNILDEDKPDKYHAGLTLKHYSFFYRKRWKPGRRGLPYENFTRYYWDRGTDHVYYTDWRRDVLITYNIITRLRMGYWGVNGFYTNINLVKKFDSFKRLNYNIARFVQYDIFYIHTTNHLYRVNALKNSVKSVYDQQILDFNIDRKVITKSNRKKQILDDLYILDANNHLDYISWKGEKIKFNLPSILTNFSGFKVTIINKNILGIIVHRSYKTDHGRKYSFKYACKSDRNGKILWEREFDKEEIKESILDKIRSQLFVISVCPVSFLPETILSRMNFMLNNDINNSKEKDMKFLEMIKPILPGLFIKFILLLCSCVFIIFKLKEKNVSKKQRIGWGLFTLFGGVPAVLAIYSVYLSEKRISCPYCKKKRYPSVEHCPHCGQEWPSPPLLDTDIV